MPRLISYKIFLKNIQAHNYIYTSVRLYTKLHMNESKILREGLFDSLVSLFKGKTDVSRASQMIADTWISEKEIDVGEELPDEIKDQVYQFVADRYERALNTYKDAQNPVRKTVLTIVKLLDKKVGPMVDDMFYNSDRMA